MDTDPSSGGSRLGPRSGAVCVWGGGINAFTYIHVLS